MSINPDIAADKDAAITRMRELLYSILSDLEHQRKYGHQTVNIDPYVEAIKAELGENA